MGCIVKGTEATVALYDETTFGADPGTPNGTKLYFETVELNTDRPMVEYPHINTARVPSRPGPGLLKTSVKIKAAINSKNMPFLLRHMFGGVTDSGANPYTHVFKPGALPTGLLVEVDYGSTISGTGRYTKFNGLKGSSVTFEFPEVGYPMATFEFVGGKLPVLASSALDASLTDTGDDPFTVFEGGIWLEGGSTFSNVNSATVTFTNALEMFYVQGSSGSVGCIAEGTVQISGDVTALFTDAALITKSINRTASSFKVPLTRGTGLGSSGNEFFELFVTACDYDPHTPGITGPSGLLQKLKLTGYKETTNLGLHITCKNAIATTA